MNEIIDYINKYPEIFIQGQRVSKEQHIVDQRTYVIFILISQHGYLPGDVAKLFNIHRSVYYNVINKIPYLLKDKVFLDNIHHLIKLFSYSEENVEKIYSLLRNKRSDVYRIRALHSYEDVFKLSKKDIDKLKDNPSVVKVIKDLIRAI
jgi:hypothetical protein